MNNLKHTIKVSRNDYYSDIWLTKEYIIFKFKIYKDYHIDKIRQINRTTHLYDLFLRV